MKRLIEFSLEAGQTVVVEIDEHSTDGMEPVSVQNLIEKSGKTFGEALSTIKPIAEAIISNLEKLNRKPDEIQVKFGVKMNAQVGAYIASACGEANYEVNIIWKQS